MPPSKRQRKKIKSVTSEEESFKAGVQKSSNWRDSPNIYRNRFKHAMEQGILTDINFTVGPQKTPFTAHKIVLGIASPVFEAMFFGSLKESNDIIHIPDIMPCGFKGLLEFVYTDSISLTNAVDAFSAWFAAEKYCMPHMKFVCFSYLCTCQLNSSNVWTMLHNALFINSETIVSRCEEYLKKHTSDAIKSPSFVEASKECIEYLVMLDVVNIEEVELLNSIVKWGKEREGADESIRQILQPFMKYIRFACMTQQELVSFVDLNKNIFSDKDVIELLKYMTDNEFYSLPEWCSPIVFPRKANNDKMNLKNIRSYILSSKNSRNENGSLQHDEQELQNITSHTNQRSNVPGRYNSDSDDSIEDFLVLPFRRLRPSPRSPSTSSLSSSTTDSSSSDM